MVFNRHLSDGKAPLSRALLRGIVLSLVFHGLLLVPAPIFLQPRGGAKPLLARWQGPAGVAPPLAAPPAQGSRRSAPQAVHGGSQGAARARPAAPPEAAGELDGEALRAYRFDLVRQAGHLLQETPALRGSGLQGRVELRLALGGGPLRVRIAQSSGDAETDAAAQRLIQQAAAAVVVPLALRGKSFEFDLPVILGDDSRPSGNP